MKPCILKGVSKSMLLTLVAFVMGAAVSFAQTKTVKGSVTDATTGESIIGANVVVVGTTHGTMTDVNGNFTLNNVPENGSLRVSYIGYAAQEVAVAGKSSFDITLKEEGEDLDEVVVVGYGTQKKADLTGSVSIVDADAMKKVSNSNISTMLEGKVSGVSITTDGQPGADPAVRIRGIGSFGSTAPLYVVDGVPMGTSIRDFSPNDIATIQVLKDAAAGAIYGSRAANGVIIITTKAGKKEQPLKVDYNGYFGWDIISSGVYDVMNADQYSQYLGQASTNTGIAPPGGYNYDATTGRYSFRDGTDTDWFKEVFKTGTRQNHNVNFSGGGKNNTYNIGLDYFKQDGTLEGAGPNYERYTARLNNDFEAKFIKFHISAVYSHSSQDGMGLSNASEYVQGLYGDVSNVLKSTLLMEPTIKAYDESTWVLDDKVGAASSYNYDAFGYGVYYDTVHGDISSSNPLLVNNKLTRNTLVDRFVGTASADVDLFKMFNTEFKNHKLNYKINLSYSTTEAKDKTWISAWIQSNRVYLDKTNETLTKVSRHYTDALIENTLTYDGKIGDHNINLVVGQTFEREDTNILTGWAKNFTEPYFLQLQNGSDTYSSSEEYRHTLASFIARLNYNYAERYLLSAIVRRDGSSRLTKDIRWETFPSVSVGWRIDKEPFFGVDENLINLLKIRGSYGELGNENIGEYQYMATMARNNMTYSFNGQAVTGSAVSTFVNENIAWEKKKTTNVGIDLAMLNNRLEFTAEWYKNKSEDLLYSVPVPASTGVANESVTMNAASMENSGFEFSVTWRDRFPFGLKYDVSANLSTLKNKVTSLGFGTDSYITGAYKTDVGEEIGKFYGWVYEGIARTQDDLDNHATQQGANVGDCLYKDISGPDGTPDGVIDAYDQTVLESGLPKVNFGLSLRLEYKGWDLNVATHGALGFHVSDDIYNALNSSYGYHNKSVSVLGANQWSEDGLTYTGSAPRTYVSNSATLAWNDLFSERMIQRADYWKIATVELGYNFPDKWFHNYVSGVRLYVSAQNLATISGYKGYNVDYAGGTFTPGYNFCSFPTPRTFMVGLHFSY